MQLDKIITVANSKVKIQFLAMERSLRATGCDLPLRVIPYDENLFELPRGSEWWVIPQVHAWLRAEDAHPTMRKYQCLLVGEYQFVDADICLLKNPAEVLHPYEGFVTCCTEWNKPEWTYTGTARRLFYQQSTTWQQKVFSSGQFACDRPLFDSVEALEQAAMRPDFAATCVRLTIHEQPGMNLLVIDSGVPMTNLTLPPICMESSWAGDYPGEYLSHWTDAARSPYMIHWAGPWVTDEQRPINELFYSFLTREEKAEWDAQIKQLLAQREQANRRKPLPVRLINRAMRSFRPKPVDIHSM